MRVCEAVRGIRIAWWMGLGWAWLGHGSQAGKAIRAPLPDKVVVLTFDDAVKSHFTVVRPLLKSLGFHATFFITEGFDFKSNKVDYLTWEEIRVLHDDGFEIGNHTRDHLGVTKATLGQLKEQVEAINARCHEHGIPRTVSFAYPGNAFVPEALPLLKTLGIRWARRGGSPEYPYEQGGGVAYEPGRDSPLLIPSVGDARPDWTLDDFRRALARAETGGLPVLQFHGVPDRQHPWVHTSPGRFRQFMQYLKQHEYQVLAMRDLERFVDSTPPPAGPGAVIRERVRRLRNAAKKRAATSPAAVPSHPLTPVERLELSHLAAAQKAAAQYQQARRSRPLPAGWKDYRAILHAHAGDSSHTGGAKPEMLAAAQRAGVDVIFLTDHYRPPRDFMTNGWSGFHEGILFIPGCEMRGFLVFPTHSIMVQADLPRDEFIQAVKRDGGLVFLSHVEARMDFPMRGLDGQEICNRHYDAMKDKAGLLALIWAAMDPKSLAAMQKALELYPDAFFAFQCDYPKLYLSKWDRTTATRRATGIAANDSHHNQVLIVKRVDAETVRVGTIVDADEDMRLVPAALQPGIRRLAQGHQPGDVLVRLDLDPYERAFRNLSTHLLACERTETAFRDALRRGHAYVSSDWMCDPTGFWMAVHREASGGDEANGEPLGIMGDEIRFGEGLELRARFPVRCRIRVLENGQVLAERFDDSIAFALVRPGVYRVEGWLRLDGEDRPWIFSNPVYLRPKKH